MHPSPGRMAPRSVAWVLAAVAFVLPHAVHASPLDRKSEGGGITVTALYLPDSDGVRFRLALDTHGGDLLAYDMAAITVLRVNGEAEAAALEWTDEAKGSHHRTGVIRFGRRDTGSSGVATLELVVRGVGGVPDRLFRWDLGRA